MKRLLVVLAWVLLAGVSRCSSGHDAYTERVLTVRGVLAGDEAECATLRDRYGVVYALVGDTGQYKRGDRVCVKGWQLDASVCGHANTLRIQSIGLARWCP